MVLVLDTNVYLDSDKDKELAQRIAAFLAGQADAIGLPSVVPGELLIGVGSPAERTRLLQRTVGVVDAGRVLTPTHADWLTAGDALDELGGDAARKGRSFWNDLLIAASCARTEATLLTRNAADFGRIQRVIPVVVRPRPR